MGLLICTLAVEKVLCHTLVYLFLFGHECFHKHKIRKCTLWRTIYNQDPRIVEETSTHCYNICFTYVIEQTPEMREQSKKLSRYHFDLSYSFQIEWLWGFIRNRWLSQMCWYSTRHYIIHELITLQDPFVLFKTGHSSFRFLNWLFSYFFTYI